MDRDYSQKGARIFTGRMPKESGRGRECSRRGAGRPALDSQKYSFLKICQFPLVMILTNYPSVLRFFDPQNQSHPRTPAVVLHSSCWPGVERDGDQIMCVSTFSFRESESVFGACGRVHVTFRSYSRFKKCGYPIIEQTVTRNQLKHSGQSAMPRHIY